MIRSNRSWTIDSRNLIVDSIMDLFSLSFSGETNLSMEASCEKIGFSRKQKLAEKIRWRTYLGKQGAFFSRRTRNPRVSFAISKGPMFHVHAPTPRSFHSTCVRHHRCLQCRQITHGGISSFFSILPFFPETTYFCGLVNVIFFLLLSLVRNLLLGKENYSNRV